MIPWQNRLRPVTSVMGMVFILLAVSLMIPPLSLPAFAAPADRIEISLDKAAPEYLGEDDELTFTGEIVNNTEVPVNSLTVWWRMRTPVLSNESLTKWLAEEDDIAPLTLARHDLDSEIEPGGKLGYEMVIPVENSPFDYGSEIGPRGIELVVTATDEEGEQLRDHVRSTIIWFPNQELPAAPMSVAVPLTPTEPEWLEALSERVPIAQTAGERVTKIVEELADHEVTWGVDASLLDSVPANRLAEFLSPGGTQGEADGEDAEDPPETTEPLEWPTSPDAMEISRAVTRQSDTRPVVSLGWAAPDYAALTRAGEDGERLRQRNQAYADELIRNAGLTADDDILWSFTPLAPGSASRFDEAITTVFVPPTPTGAEFVPPTSRHITIRSPEQDLADLFLESTPPHELRARTLIYSQENSQLFITLPPEITSEDAKLVAENLQVLTSAPWVQLSSPSPPAESDFSLSSPLPIASDTSPVDLADLTDSLSRAYSLAQITEDPDRFASLFDSAAFLALSHALGEEKDIREELLTEVRRGAESQFLEIEQPSTVNLISQGGELPIGVENFSPIPLTPTVVVQPGDVRLLAEEPVQSTLDPGQSSTVRVPITAVANGNVTATIRLLDNEGTDVAAPQTFTVRVRADWETTGTAVIAGIVAVGFLFGLIRNFRNASGRHGREQHG